MAGFKAFDNAYGLCWCEDLVVTNARERILVREKDDFVEVRRHHEQGVGVGRS